MARTYLEQLDNTGILKLVRRYQETKLSPLMHAMHYTLLAMYGDREAAKTVREYLRSEEKNTDPIIKVVTQLLRGRIEKIEWTPRVLPYLKNHNPNDISFKDFQSEPAQISQIKKIINALYHAEQALKLIEELNLDSLSRKKDNTVAEALEVLSGEFTDHCYELALFLTHPDVDLVTTFGMEVSLIKSLVIDLYGKIPAFFKGVERYLSHEHNVNIPKPDEFMHKLGELSAQGIKHLKPTQKTDWSSISYWSADVSTQLNKLTQSIQKTANLYFTKSKYLNQKDFEQYEMDSERLRELDNAGGRLAKAFDDLYAGGLFQPLNALGFVSIFRNAMTLTNNILQEASNFNTANKDLLKAFFAELKYGVFLNLVTSLDKLEEETTLRAGISTRVVKGLDEFYGAFFNLVEGYVDISATGQDLGCLVESQFIELRVQAAIKRQAEREKINFKQQEHEKKVDKFFNLLNAISLKYPGIRLRDLNDETKTILKDQYKIIQPYVSELDVKLSNAIVKGLTHTQASTFWESAFDDLNTITGNIAQDWLGDYPDRLSKILNSGYSISLMPVDAPSLYLSAGNVYLKPINGQIGYTIKKENGEVISDVTTIPAPKPFTLAYLKPIETEILTQVVRNEHILPPMYTRLKNRFQKEKATLDFQAQLNQDVIHAIYESQDTLLQHPYSIDKNFFEINEIDVLIASKHIADTAESIEGKDLSTAGTLALYEFYIARRNKFNYIEESLEKFIEQLSHNNPTTSLSKLLMVSNQLRNEYTVFQSAFISALKILEGEKSAVEMDKAIIAALSGRKDKTIIVGNLLDKCTAIQSHIKQERLKLNERVEEIETALMAKINIPSSDELKLDDETRAYYLIKKPFFNDLINNTEQKLNELIAKFSPEIQKAFVPNEQRPLIDKYLIGQLINLESGVLPFPEVDPAFEKIDSAVKFYQEPKEIIALKKLINGLYHLKETSIQLEQLNEHSSKKLYVWRLFQINRHIVACYDISSDVKKDPYVGQLAKEVCQLLETTGNTVETLRKPYTPEKKIEDSNIETHDTVFNIVNALMVSTKQVERFPLRKFVSQKELEKIHEFSEKFAEDVRRIIDKSDSYFDLLTEVGTSISLLTKITNRWKAFAKSLHNSVEQNLESIYTVVFTETLIEIDEWECKLGLAPGILSEPLKKIVDDYYQGVVHILSREAWHEVDLVATLHGFHQRIEKANEHLEKTKADLIRIKNDQVMITQFNQAWSENEATMYQVFLAPETTTAESIENTNHFLTLFQTLKKLPNYQITFQQCCGEALWPTISSIAVIGTAPISIGVDQKEAFKQAWCKISHVCMAHQEGLMHSAELRLANIDGQKNYLEKKRKEQSTLNQNFEIECIRKLVKDQLQKHQSVAKNLLYDGDKLYDHALEGAIGERLPQFISQVTRSQSLEIQVDKFVKEQVALFDSTYLEEYQQFNLLHESVQALTRYTTEQLLQLALIKKNGFFDYTWSFENVKTLEAKIRRLERLEKILKNKDHKLDDKDPWSIKTRIKAFSEEVNTEDFENDILRYHKFNAASFDLLVKWLVELLKVLKIYKPKAEIIYEQLKSSTKVEKNKHRTQPTIETNFRQSKVHFLDTKAGKEPDDLADRENKSQNQP